MKLKKMVVCLVLLSPVACAAGCSNWQDRAQDAESRKTINTSESNDVVEASVVLTVDYTDDVGVGVRIRNEKIIDDHILAPLSKATADLEPAKYEYLGSLVLTHKNGKTTPYALYAPWGHISRDGRYSIADLGKLRAVVKKALGSVVLGQQVSGTNETNHQAPKNGDD